MKLSCMCGFEFLLKVDDLKSNEEKRGFQGEDYMHAA
jgi:hypothetical protein